MRRQAILNLPLCAVLRQEIALPLQVLDVFTIGQFLGAWQEPGLREQVSAMFDSPQQARHAVAVCANWLGGRHAPVMRAGLPAFGQPWWRDDAAARVGAVVAETSLAS